MWQNVLGRKAWEYAEMEIAKLDDRSFAVRALTKAGRGDVWGEVFRGNFVLVDLIEYALQNK